MRVSNNQLAKSTSRDKLYKMIDNKETEKIT